jgi:hypothetical protein
MNALRLPRAENGGEPRLLLHPYALIDRSKRENGPMFFCWILYASVHTRDPQIAILDRSWPFQEVGSIPSNSKN